MSFDTQRREALVSERILESMRDGVVTIDLTGRILTFNAAAGRILGKDPETVVGRSFGEVFLTEESFDDFNEVVFRAVYDAETTHSIEIALAVDGRMVNLFVSSSFLVAEDVAGEEERLGVVVVFSDITEERKRRKIKRLFGAYVDPRIVERILTQGELDGTSSRREDMTISFVDMRDFTGWTERLEPDALIDLLNRFLAAMTKPIGAAGGITDKYIGDAVMACWGPPFTDAETQAIDACTAALGQYEALEGLRLELADAGFADARRMDAVIGVATGQVIAGDVGPDASRNYTVIGHAVNLAARLQEAAKRLGHPIIVSEATAQRVGDQLVFRELDRIVPRGSAHAESVFALLGRPGEVSDTAREIAGHHEAGLAAMRARDWDRASDCFAECLKLDPADWSAKVMAGRLKHYSETPPPEDWDGVWIAPGLEPSKVAGPK
ncbi:adenylate/guanylate cyclase domain-containing protein [Amorphus orientalis]|uniref:Adenylate cyclase n=1 Tax=Amorphus orientalis TaxID=649198 RepID=A0AAE4AW97_9HYPH|nr:adenylate/guanylate cyclase domain-containing protein [Amorphus orientalis]MDQ0317549.1 adenylate cyclase [Amorphus orientalis]